MAYYSDNYRWDSSPSSPTHFPISRDSSPLSTHSTVGHGSDFSANSGLSSHTSRSRSRGRAVYINDVKVATISPSGRVGEHDSSRPRGLRRQSVVINPDSHVRTGSHSSSNSPLSPRVVEPAQIYIEKNIGDARPPHRFIYDNRGRSVHSHRHNNSGSDVLINVHPTQTRNRSGKRSASRPRHVHAPNHPMYPSASEDEAAVPTTSHSHIQRKSSMKRPTGGRGRRKSVSFQQPAVHDLVQGMDAISLQNRHIGTRPSVPAQAQADIDYLRPHVVARKYTSTMLQNDRQAADDADEDRRRERLRHRQTPMTKRDGERKRRASVVQTAPPIGLYYKHYDSSY